MISIVAPLLVLYFLYVGKKHGGEKIGCSSPSGIAGRNNLEPKGLNNLSNTCFLNAVLQALYMSEPYNELITSSSFADGSVGSELQNVFKRLGDCTEGPVRPVELAVLLGLNIDEQQDAEELLLQVLNGVDDSVKQRSSNIRAPSRALQIKTLQRLSCTDVAFKKEKVHRSFDISLDIAGHRDVNAALKAYFQPEPLVGANQYQTGKLGLQDAVKSLFLLKNRYNRSASAIAESGRSTDELPEVLVLHLKRFAFDPSTGAMTKVGDPLQVPLSIDVSPYLSQPDQPLSGQEEAGREASSGGCGCEYDLTSVVVHTGRLDNGHYVCLARLPLSAPSAADKEAGDRLATRAGSGGDSCSSINCGDSGGRLGTSSKGDGGRWFLLDDHRVREVSEAQVLALAEGGQSAVQQGVSSNAYMLFYTRKKRRHGR